jgi:hypothetical protein
LLGSNLLLDGKMVQITLYKPFSTLASCLDSSIWLPLLDMLRVKYYDAVVAISKELELAKQYLGNGLSDNQGYAT